LGDLRKPKKKKGEKIREKKVGATLTKRWREAVVSCCA